MIEIYTLDNCPFCNELKEGLTAEGIEYVEKDVSIPKFEAEYDVLADRFDTDDVPVMVIDKRVFIPDVSFKNISDAVGLAKRFTK